MGRRYRITVDTEGTTLEVFSEEFAGSPATPINFGGTRFSTPTIADLGTDLTVVLRQETVIGETVSGQVDEVFVTTDANYVPPNSSAMISAVPEPSAIGLIGMLGVVSALAHRWR